MEQHPRIAKYAMENHNLREENKKLRSLQSVKKAQEIDAQTIAELEKAFSEASATEKSTKGTNMLMFSRSMCLLCFCCVQLSVENVCLDVFLPSSKWYLKTDKTIPLNCIHVGLPAIGNFDLHLVKLIYNLILCPLVAMKTASNINYYWFSCGLLPVSIFVNFNCCCAVQKLTNTFILVKL